MSFDFNGVALSISLFRIMFAMDLSYVSFFSVVVCFLQSYSLGFFSKIFFPVSTEII